MNDATKNTLTAGDTVSGGEGADTLSLVATTTGSATVTGLMSTGVETIKVQNADTTAANALTIDMTSVADVTELQVTSSTAGVVTSNQKAIADLSVSFSQDDITLGYTSAATTGSASVQNITLNGVNTTASGTISFGGIETVNVTTTGAASGSSTKTTTLADTSSTKVMGTVNVAGDQKSVMVIDFSGYADSVITTATYSAAEATAAQTVTLTIDADDLLSATGGSAGDTFTINQISKNVTVSGGEGLDYVSTNQTALTQYDLANIDAEVMIHTNLPTSVDFTGNTSFVASVYGGGFGAGTLAGVASGYGVTTYAAGTSLGVTLTDATGKSDALGVTLGKSTTTGGVAAGTLTASGVETIAITSAGKAELVPVANTLTIAGSSVENITVGGSRNLTVTSAGASVTSYDATDATGAQTTSNITFSALGATVKGGSGTDTLTGGAGSDTIHGNAGNDTISGAAGKDTIEGGAGNDSITGGTGADTMSGGDGADVFTIADGDSVTSGMDVISDFTSGTDRLVLGQSAAGGFIGNFASLAEALAAMTAGSQAFFVTGSSQLYVVASQGTFQATDDIVKLSGVTALAAADVGQGSLGAGGSISLTAASAILSTTTATNATAKTSNKDDTITSSVANLVGSTIDGALGVDTLTVTTAFTSSTDLGAVTTSIEKLNLATVSTSTNTLTNVEQGIIAMGGNGDNVTLASSVTNVAITGSDEIDTISTAAIKGTIDTGKENDLITLSATASFGDLTVTGGAGNDKVTFSEAGTIDVAANSILTLDFGTGSADEIALSGSGGAVDLTAAGFAIKGLDKISGVDTTAQTVTLDSSLLSQISSLTLGTGADVLKLSGASSFDLDTSLTMSGVEKYTLLTAGATLTVAAGDIKASTDDVIVGVETTDTAAGGTLIIADDTAVNLTGSSLGGAVINIGTLQFKNATTTIGNANIYDGTDDADEGFRIITGSGEANTALTISAGDTAIDLQNVAVTGVKTITAIQAGSGAASTDAIKVDAADLAGVTSFVISDGTGTAKEDLDLTVKTSGDISSVIWSNTDNKFDTVSFNVGDEAAQTLTVSSSLFGILASAYTIDGSGSTVNDGNLAVSMDAGSSALDLSGMTGTDIASVVINDSTDSQTYTLDDANTALGVTANLAGGTDTFAVTVITSDGTSNSTMVADAVTITGFNAGLVGNATKFAITTDSTAVAAVTAITTATDISAATTQAAAYEISGTSVSDLGDFTAVQTAINNFVSVATDNAEITFILYGTYDGVENSAGIYNAVMNSTAGVADAIDLVGVLKGGVAEDSLDAANFI